MLAGSAAGTLKQPEEHTRMFDVAIIGAGPAGATLARLIAPKWKVLLVDGRHLTSDSGPDSPPKCCGGLLAPDGQQMLGALGLGLPRYVLVEPQVFVVRVIDLHHRVERCYQRHYINIDREAFDRWLVSLIPPAVDMRLGCRFISCEPDSGGFRIDLSHDGRRYAERARLVIGADGARSNVRKLAFARRPFPKVYTAIQEWFDCDHPLPYFSAIFDPEVTDYYSWAIPKQNSLLVGSALLPGPGCRARFELLKRKLGEFGLQLGRSVRTEAATLLRPTNPGQVCTGGNGIGLIGEAAGWISPSSAEGMSYAFRSAIIMADALQGGLEGSPRRYRRKAARLKRNILLKNVKSCFIYGPWLRKMIMLSGFGSMKVAGCC